MVIKDNESVNLIGEKKLSLLLENKIDDSNHNFLFGKERISQGGFNKIDNKDALEIIDEAIKLNPNQIEILSKLKDWLLQGDFTMVEQENMINSNKKIWKVSHGISDYFTEEKITNYLNDSCVCVHKNTKAKGISSVSQGEDFTQNVNTGDLFYLCRGNQKFLLIGEFTSDSIEIDEEGWAFRKYRKLYTPIKNESYNGPSKWWTPNNNSTFIEIKKNDYLDFESLILKPFFGIDLQTLNLINEERNMKKINETKKLLENTKNLILTGAPGTGKTFMAKQIAKAMGCSENEIGFVQFHPSYDYTDFVEGLRPKQNDGSNQIGFERMDGVFKEFCAKALKNLVDSRKQSVNEIKNFDEIFEQFVSDIEENHLELKTLKQQKEFSLRVGSQMTIYAIPKTETGTNMGLSKDKIKKYLETGEILDWKPYLTAIGKYIEENYEINKTSESIPLKPFVFIIDEINRGEVSKIFGELFYCVDPGYRGEKGKISTQYQNLVTSGEFQKGFFIPENVYIIGTMNDIDRSVESMDFAFRRRFAWKEITADDTQYMLDEVEKDGETFGLPDDIAVEAKERMNRVNNKISELPDFNSAYHIGASYFLKLKNYESDSDNGFQSLWNYHLKGILEEYLRGNPDKDNFMKQLENAYNGESGKTSNQ